MNEAVSRQPSAVSPVLSTASGWSTSSDGPRPPAPGPRFPRRRERGALLAAGVMLACLLLGAGTLHTLESDRGPTAPMPGAEVELLPPPDLARALALSYRAVAADLFWVRTVLYLGWHVEHDQRFPKLAALLDLVVTLDPHFVEAYRIGALFLGFVARDLPAATRLLERGVQATPERWELPHDLGRLYMVLGKDPGKAMTWFRQADALAGRPEYVPRIIAKLATQAGQREVAIELWVRIYRESENAHVRDQAERELRSLGVRIRREPPSGEGAAKGDEGARR